MTSVMPTTQGHPVHERRVVAPIRTDSWRAVARCRGLDSCLFYPYDEEDGDDARVARQVCAECPVVDECLESAIENREEYGIWGGKSPRQRRSIKRMRRKSA